MLNLTSLANQLKTSPVLLADIQETLVKHGTEATLEIIDHVFTTYVKGKKGVKGTDAAMSYLARVAADQARDKSQPQLGLMQNMQTLRGQLVEQFDPVTSEVADDVNVELIRRTVAKTVASNLDQMPKAKSLLNQLGGFTSQQSANFSQGFDAEQSMAMFLGATAAYQTEGNPSFLLSASTMNLLTASPELVESTPEVETAIA